MELKRVSRPQYRKLQDTLRKQILGGVYQEGDLLPSEHELCALHNVARSTVRQALGELVSDGYILKKKGKGSIVSAKRRSLGLLSFRGFSEVVGQTEQTVNSVVLKKLGFSPWPDPFFYALSSAEQKAHCISLKRLRCVDQDPVMLEYTYIPNLGLPHFCSRALVNGSLFDTLNVNYHVAITRMDQDVRAVAADAYTASLLQMHQGTPVLHIYRRYITNREGLFIYSSLFCNTDTYAIGTTFA